MNEASQPIRRPYSVPEAAKYFGKSQTFIKRMCQDGTLLMANCTVWKRADGKWVIYIPE